MSNQFKPHPYQQECINAIIERPGVALWLEMGLGKTVVTLTAIAALLQLSDVSKVLIIAPKKVAEATWQDEAKKWEHLQGLRMSTVLGTAKQRERALSKKADIYITNRDNVVWLEKRYGRRWPFDMVVLDEASSFKHHSTQRFKALRRMRPHINRVVELTGTPAPKDYMDLWAQVYLLDQGQRLGQRFTQYRDNYFQPDKRNGMQIYSWKPRKGAEEAIQAKLADVAISIQAADHLQLPEKIIEDIPVVLPPKDWATYQEMQNQRLLEVDTETITAMQAATLTGKLLQLCNGAMYDAEKQVHPLNRCKLDAFDELIDALDGQRALVFYAFEFDKEFLQAELKTRERGISFAVLKGREEADAWNRGELDVLLAQPASCAYGLNLQAGRSPPDLVQLAVEPGTLRAGQRPALQARPAAARHHTPPAGEERRGRAGSQSAGAQRRVPAGPGARHQAAGRGGAAWTSIEPWRSSSGKSETAGGWACRRATCQSRRQNSGENSGSRPRRASRNRQPHRRKPQAHQSSAGPCPTRSASSWSDGPC